MGNSKKAFLGIVATVVLFSVFGGGRTNNDDSYLMHWFVDALQSGDLVGALASGVLLLALAAFVFRNRIDYKGFGGEN